MVSYGQTVFSWRMNVYIDLWHVAIPTLCAMSLVFIRTPGSNKNRDTWVKNEVEKNAKIERLPRYSCQWASCFCWVPAESFDTDLGTTPPPSSRDL